MAAATKQIKREQKKPATMIAFVKIIDGCDDATVRSFFACVVLLYGAAAEQTGPVFLNG